MLPEIAPPNSNHIPDGTIQWWRGDKREVTKTWFLNIGKYESVADKKSSATAPRVPTAIPRPARTPQSHNERCAECKRNIEALLSKLYGSVIRNPSVLIPATPDGLDNSAVSNTLHQIYTALQENRGFSSFVRREHLPRCDFFVPSPGFLIEFDESQHFTAQRKLTLGFYPADLHFGFDLPKWMELCDKLHQHDDHPPFRAEQRAWYDTLRDFAPYIKQLMPTLRLYAEEFEWCKEFNPDSKPDVDTFRQVLGERANFWRLEFRTPTQPKLARIAVDGSWLGSPSIARKLIEDICQEWPSGLHVKSISTPGAFLRFRWPESISPQKDNRFSAENAIRHLDAEARVCIEKLLDGALRRSLAECADYLTVGIDTGKEKISSTDNYIAEDHAELVYVVNLQNGALHFTGKSYPTPNQERGLQRVTDLHSHFTNMGGENVMVLGCHDLTIFNPRSDANARGWRKDIKLEFKKIAERNAPAIVLHHPHTTVKRRTWSQAWIELRGHLPSVHSYVGTGCYSFRDSINGRNRDPLDAVLEATSHRIR